MKLHWWIKGMFFVGAAALIAMTASIDDGRAAVKTSQSATSHTARQKGPPSGQEATARDLHVELERLARRDRAGEPGVQEAEDGISGIFGVTSWYVPPPPPPPSSLPPPPPPRPTAPPLPFSYLGRYQESQSLIIMLVRGDRVFTVSAGDVIENTYRVEGLVDGRVELTYLPLNIRQTIDTGEVS